MKSLLQRIIPLAFMLVSLAVCAQQTSPDPDRVYGPDQLLYNGKLYTFFPPARTEGNQFISDNYFEDGTVTVRGKRYEGLGLNYDLYNQELILKYSNRNGGTDLIAVSDAWLEAFSLGKNNFEMIATGDTVKHIYQVMGSGSNRVFYFRRKVMRLESRYMSWNQVFSAPVRNMYVYNGRNLAEYNNNKSFIAIFDKSVQPSVKKYLRQHKIKVKKAADPVITDLINFCNSLSPS
jgi:hypothetical protein